MPDNAPAIYALLINQIDFSFPQISYILSYLKTFAHPLFSAKIALPAPLRFKLKCHLIPRLCEAPPFPKHRTH